jgi:hypothetical protein
MKTEAQIKALLAQFDWLVAHPTPPQVPEYKPDDHDRSMLCQDILRWVLDLPSHMDTHSPEIKASFDKQISKDN